MCVFVSTSLSYKKLNTYRFCNGVMWYTQDGTQRGLQNRPRNLHDIIASVLGRNVAIPSEQLRVRMRAIEVENLVAGFDIAESCGG